MTAPYFGHMIVFTKPRAWRNVKEDAWHILHEHKDVVTSNDCHTHQSIACRVSRPKGLFATSFYRGVRTNYFTLALLYFGFKKELHSFFCHNQLSDLI